MRLMHSILVGVILTGLIFAVACDDDDDDLVPLPDNEVTVPLFSGSVGQEVTATHAASGASFTISAGTLVYRVPGDTVTFGVYELSQEAETVAPFTVLGGATFRPDYAEFATPVTITLPAYGLTGPAHVFHYNVREMETSQTGLPIWTDMGEFMPIQGMITMEVQLFGSFVVGRIGDHDQGIGGTI